MALLAPVSFPAEPTAVDIAASAVAASAGGDTFRNVGRTGFWVANTSGAPRTVTFDAPMKCNHGFNHDSAVIVADGFSGLIARFFDPTRFNDESQIVTATYSSEAGLAVAVVRLE